MVDWQNSMIKTRDDNLLIIEEISEGKRSMSGILANHSIENHMNIRKNQEGKMNLRKAII